MRKLARGRSEKIKDPKIGTSSLIRSVGQSLNQSAAFLFTIRPYFVFNVAASLTPLFRYIENNRGLRQRMRIYVDLLMVSDALLILCGAMMYWFSPRIRPNWLLGYGSARSMISHAAWRAANRFAGQALSLLALISLSVHAACWKSILTDQGVQTVAVLGVLCLPFLVMYLTERYLIRVFWR